jgi:hypothetical protein
MEKLSCGGPLQWFLLVLPFYYLQFFYFARVVSGNALINAPVFAITIYVLSRLLLLVEAFISLRHFAGMFAIVKWTSFIPHILVTITLWKLNDIMASTLQFKGKQREVCTLTQAKVEKHDIFVNTITTSKLSEKVQRRHVLHT